MKTAILQLETYDDYSSICDKMGWSRATRIILVWPKRGKILREYHELKLIQRQASALGAQVAFVCRDRLIDEYAQVLQIPVFPSLPKAESSHWPRQIHLVERQPSADFFKKFQSATGQQTVKAKNQESSKLVRWLSIGLASLALISLVIFIFPSATIMLYPVTETKNIPISIWASTQVHETNLNGSLPAYEKSIEVSASAEGQSTGTTDLPIEYAVGNVTFINLTKNDIVVPAGTIISTADPESIRFVTSDSVTVMGVSTEPVSVGVKALQAGSSGDVDQDTLTVIEGTLGSLLTVTNSSPISGGADEQAPSPTEADYAKLKKSLLNQLSIEATQTLQQQEGLQLIDGSLDEGKTIEETRSVEPGQPADSFSLTIRVKFTGLMITSSDLEKIATEVMNASLSKGQKTYCDGVTIQQLDKPDGSLAEGMKWNIFVSCAVGADFDALSLTKLVTGKKIEEARTILLAQFQSRAEPFITTFPADWKWMPLASFNINVEVH